jgi:hypothetical protein
MDNSPRAQIDAILKAHQPQNPYQKVPRPKPLEGGGWRAVDVCCPAVLSQLLDDNAGWLQSRSRTTHQIHDALLPQYDLCGMDQDEVYQQLNRFMWDAGYSPSTEGSRNPTWTWTEGN